MTTYNITTYKLMVAVLATLLAAPTFALDIDPTFYGGFEASASEFKYKQPRQARIFNNEDMTSRAKVRPWGATILMGSRLNDDLGVELSYGLIGKHHVFDSAAIANYHFKTTHLTVDAIGYLPINEAVEGIASIGLSQLTTTATLNVQFQNPGIYQSYKLITHKVVSRFGLGAQYKVNESMSLRLMGRIQSGNAFARQVNSLSLGALYQF